MKCWGFNMSGALGYGDEDDRGLMANQMGDYLPLVNLGITFPPNFISTGFGYTCIIFSNYQLKCYGQNDGGQLGLETTFHQGDNANEMGTYLPFLNLGTGVEISKSK